jgi:serine/threonine-protein kinase
MAPEQILCEEIDARADVYALGAVAFRALTGRLPFPSEDDALVAAQHLFQLPTSLCSLVPDVDPDVERVVLTAMRKNPNNRYTTMDAMRADLARLVGLEPGDVTGAVMRSKRDVYEPKTEGGRAAAAAFLQRYSRQA